MQRSAPLPDILASLKSIPPLQQDGTVPHVFSSMHQEALHALLTRAGLGAASSPLHSLLFSRVPQLQPHTAAQEGPSFPTINSTNTGGNSNGGFLSLLAAVLGPATAAGGASTGGIHNAGWKDLIVQDCTGTVRVSNGLTGTTINYAMSAVEEPWLEAQITQRAKCACPSISDAEIRRRFLPSLDMLVAMLDGVRGGEGGVMDSCPGAFPRTFFQDSFFGMITEEHPVTWNLPGAAVGVLEQGAGVDAALRVGQVTMLCGCVLFPQTPARTPPWPTAALATWKCTNLPLIRLCWYVGLAQLYGWAAVFTTPFHTMYLRFLQRGVQIHHDHLCPCLAMVGTAATCTNRATYVGVVAGVLPRPCQPCC